MCDYSLHNVASRPARVGDKLTTRDFRYRYAADSLARRMFGLLFAFFQEPNRHSPNLVECGHRSLLEWGRKTFDHRTAIFRQINKERAAAHHDALEFPDGQLVCCTSLWEGQEAVVLQLPAQPTTASETEAQKRAAYAG